MVTLKKMKTRVRAPPSLKAFLLALVTLALGGVQWQLVPWQTAS